MTQTLVEPTDVKSPGVTWTLVRKDLRLLRPVFVGAAALAALFCIGLPAVSLYGRAVRLSREVAELGYSDHAKLPSAVAVFAAGLVMAATIVLATLPLWATAVGGMAFAHERRERWADLPGVLPVTRRRLVGLKLATSVAACVAMLLAGMAVGLIGQQVVESTRDGYVTWRFIFGLSTPPTEEFMRTAVTMAGLSAATFGIAWMVSTMVRSPVIAAGVSIGLTLVAIVCWAQVPRAYHSNGWPVQDGWWVAEHVLPWAVGLVTILVGTVWATKQAEP